MKYWERFTSLKQRGEWVELQFMARAAQHCFAVSKPWGDTQAYDVGIEHEENFLRVQVKSTTQRSGAVYRCMFMPNHQKNHDYSLSQIDLFAAYVIPEDAWYLIPAVLLLGQRRRTMAALCPVLPPAKKASYIYEGYREAWNLLKKSRAELVEWRREEPRASHKGAASTSQNVKSSSSLVSSTRQLRFERARPCRTGSRIKVIVALVAAGLQSHNFPGGPVKPGFSLSGEFRKRDQTIAALAIELASRLTPNAVDDALATLLRTFSRR